MKLKNRLRLITIITLLISILYGCNPYVYKPTVMPTGKGELTRKQIRRDFTN